MTRRHAWPDGHWGWLIPVTHKHGLRAGPLAFVGGQVDKDTRGLVLHPYDRPAQTAVVMAHIRTVLRELGVDPAGLVKLVAFYASDEGRVDEAALLHDIARHLGGPAPAITAVPVPYLAYPGMLVEIEAIAMAAEDGGPLARRAAALGEPGSAVPPFADGIRCGTMIHVGGHTGHGDGAASPEAAGARAIQKAGRALAALDASPEDVVKVNVYYVGAAGGAGLGRSLSGIARGLGGARPVVTAIPLPWLPDGAGLRLDLVAMRRAEGAPLPRAHAELTGHWDWPGARAWSHGLRSGRLVHVGAQMALDADGRVSEPGALVPQTRAVMGLVGRVLGAFGARLDDVVKVNAFYRSGGTAEDLNANLGIRSSCFTEPGPTTTGIPVPALAIDGVTISVDVLAMLDPPR
ncbi:MAG: hypothetical protein L0027_10785 [Candidatus Rokubacteria bacterium]|nr:hypothetical protein [Candidatus Rokubacteria bacterium]